MTADTCQRPARRSVEFFREHAGYAVGRRLEGALTLARAACAASKLGWRTVWIPEHDADLSWMTARERKQPHEVFCASMTDRRGDHQATLCGIVDPSSADTRVVEASLAVEARAYQQLQERKR